MTSREHMPTHEKQCAHRQVKCAGCGEANLISQLETHQASCQKWHLRETFGEHFDALHHTVMEMQQEIVRLRTRDAQIQRIIGQMQGSINSMAALLLHQER